ncbi:MAG: hypothetical protein V2A71_02520 [Candidatus Eisenbacteria bacterium]
MKCAQSRPPVQANLLRGTRVYLSGPMDFVASRAYEKKHGWRTRIGQFLSGMGAIVYDPWNKPHVRGFHEYGREDVDTTSIRERWTFEDSPRGAGTRAGISGKFWETLHIDLRMVDTSDFTIAYCPTNVYSVGTPHEIVIARQQRKPVLFVSPAVEFTALEELRKHLRRDRAGLDLLKALEQDVPIKPNPEGVPSLWYMPLVGGESFFDGFGFDLPRYRQKYGWRTTPLDEREKKRPPKRPLLSFLEQLNERLPEKWDNRRKQYVPNDDWLLLAASM